MSIVLDSIDSKRIVFSLKFTNLEAISRKNHFDRLQIKIKDPELFISKNGLVRMQSAFSNGNSITKDIPPQISKEDAEKVDKMAKTSEYSVMAVSSGNFFLSFLVSASLQHMWGMLRAMQYMTLSMLVRVPLPPHDVVFFEQLA